VITSAQERERLERLDAIGDKEAARRMSRLDDRSNAIRFALRRLHLLRFVKALFPEYQDGWFHRDVIRKLEKFSDDVAAKKSPRLMLCAPPGVGKSFMTSETFPVWHLGKHPDHQIIVASHTKQSALRRSRAARRFAKDSVTAETFPWLELDPAAQGIEEWYTTAGGRYQAVGVGGSITGGRAHILVGDDLIKGREQAFSAAQRENIWGWFGMDARSRLFPGGGILLINTRWHSDDISGRILKQIKSGEADEWVVAIYPAIAEEDEYDENGILRRAEGEALHPERYPLEEVLSMMRDAGPYGRESLYQQRPVIIGGNIWKESWFKFYRITDLSSVTIENPWTGEVETHRFVSITHSWDCTFKDTDQSDFVAGQAWGEVRLKNPHTKRVERHYFLLHQHLERMDIVVTIQAIKALQSKVPGRVVLIEDKANGTAAIRLLRGKVSGLLPVDPRGGKAARMVAASAPIADGRVWLPNAEIAPWVIPYLNEVTTAPSSAHDDQADSTSQYLLFAEERGSSGPRVAVIGG